MNDELMNDELKKFEAIISSSSSSNNNQWIDSSNPYNIYSHKYDPNNNYINVTTAPNTGAPCTWGSAMTWGAPVATIKSTTLSGLFKTSIVSVDGVSYTGMLDFLTKKIGYVLSIKKCDDKIGVFIIGKLVAVFNINRLRECDEKELSF